MFVFVSVCVWTLECARVSTCVCVWAYTGTDTSLRCNLRVVEIRRTCTQLSSERDIFGQAHSVSLFCCHYWADSRPKVDRDNPNRYRDHVSVNSLDYQRWLIWVLTVVWLSIPVPYLQLLSKLMTGILLTMRSKDKDWWWWPEGWPRGGSHVWRTPVTLPPLFLPPSSFALARPVNDDVVTVCHPFCSTPC